MTMNTDVAADNASRRQRGTADFMLVFFAMITGGGIVFLLTAFGIIPHLQFGNNIFMVGVLIAGILLASVGWMRIFKKNY